jgi:hypothetical protein
MSQILPLTLRMDEWMDGWMDETIVYYYYIVPFDLQP